VLSAIWDWSTDLDVGDPAATSPTGQSALPVLVVTEQHAVLRHFGAFHVRQSLSENGDRTRAATGGQPADAPNGTGHDGRTKRHRVVRAACCDLHLPCLFIRNPTRQPDAIAVITGHYPPAALVLINILRRALDAPAHTVGFAATSEPALPPDVLEAANAITLAQALNDATEPRVQWDVVHARRLSEALHSYTVHNPTHLVVIGHDTFPCRTPRCGTRRVARHALTPVLIT
jgi:hypothetical protein